MVFFVTMYAIWEVYSRTTYESLAAVSAKVRKAGIGATRKIVYAYVLLGGTVDPAGPGMRDDRPAHSTPGPDLEVGERAAERAEESGDAQALSVGAAARRPAEDDRESGGSAELVEPTAEKGTDALITR